MVGPSFMIILRLKKPPHEKRSEKGERRGDGGRFCGVGEGASLRTSVSFLGAVAIFSSSSFKVFPQGWRKRVSIKTRGLVGGKESIRFRGVEEKMGIERAKRERGDVIMYQQKRI